MRSCSEPVMLRPGSECQGLCTYAGKIVVAGGMDGGKHAETVQRFDWEGGKWISLTLPETVAGQRSFLAACVVEHPLS